MIYFLPIFQQVQWTLNDSPILGTEYHLGRLQYQLSEEPAGAGTLHCLTLPAVRSLLAGVVAVTAGNAAGKCQDTARLTVTGGKLRLQSNQ